MNELQGTFAVSQRRACRVVDQPRQTQRYQQKVRDDEPALIKQILELVREYPRYGYRFIWAKLRQLGWKINKKRVHRIWKQEGLKVPVKKRKKRRLGNSNNSASRRQATGANEVWSWDFIFDRTVTGKQLKWLVIVDEFTRENLCLEVGYNFTSNDIINELAKLSATRGLPQFIRSDNGPELIALACASGSYSQKDAHEYARPSHEKSRLKLEAAFVFNTQLDSITRSNLFDQHVLPTGS